MKMEVFFDYTCPYCYIGMYYLNDLITDYPEIEIDWKPAEAHPEPEPQMNFPETSSFWQKGILAVAQNAGVEIKYPLMPISYTNKAIEGFVYLKEHGASPNSIASYNKNIMDAAYLYHKDIGNYDVIVEAASDTGTDIYKLKGALENSTYAKKQKDLNRYAYAEKGIEALPTFIVGDDRYEAELGVGITKNALKEFLDKVSSK